MKKIISLALCLVLAFAMAGCEELETIKNELPPPPNSAQAQQEAEPAPAAETPEPEVEKFPVLPVENPIIVKNEKTVLQDYDPADGTQLILSFSYDTPKVYIEGRDEVSSKINEYIGLVNEEYYSGAAENEYDIYAPIGYNLMLQEATDNFTYYYENNEAGMSLEYSASQSTSVTRADRNILSLVLHSSVYKGGAHGSYADFGYVFDTETGERLSLESLSPDYEALSSFIIDKMIKLVEADADSYYSDRIVFVEPQNYADSFRSLLREGSWYFDNDGMVIFSQTEELGPYAAGIVKFSIPYAELKGVIYEKYIPQNREGAGEFSIAALEDVQDGSVEILDRLVVDEGAQELVLKAEGNLYDISLTTVSYADKFYELDQLWYCSEMGGTAIQLVTEVPEGVPNLMLKYRDSDGTEHRCLISQNGIDGSFTLISDEIETVG